MPQPSLFFFILTTGRRCSLPSPAWNLFAQVSVLESIGAELATLPSCHSHCLPSSCSGAITCSPATLLQDDLAGIGPLPLLHNSVHELVKLSFDQNFVLATSFSRLPSSPFSSRFPRCLSRLEPRHVSRWLDTTLDNFLLKLSHQVTLSCAKLITETKDSILYLGPELCTPSRRLPAWFFLSQPFHCHWGGWSQFSAG